MARPSPACKRSWDRPSVLRSSAVRSGTFHTPSYQQWSFGIQQAIGDKSSLSLGYVGNHGVDVPVYNEGLNAFGAGYAPFPNTAPTSIFGAVQEYSSAGVSNYNGLTASFNQRVTYGFTVQASYTWSHAIDEVSNNGVLSTPYNNTNATFSATPSTVQYQINPTCLRCYNYGSADYDIRNSFSASYVWQTPFKFGNKYMNGALGGWTLSQNFFARTGLPFTVIDGNVTIPNYTPLNPPAQVLGPAQGSCSNGLSNCLAFNQFATATTAFPNQIRNGFRGPGFFDSDFTINKNFKLTERMAFGIGANFYNIFNHPNFTNPDNNFADGDPAHGRHLRQGPDHHGASDRSLWCVRTRPAFGTHHPIPGQAGVLTPISFAGRRQLQSGLPIFLVRLFKEACLRWSMSLVLPIAPLRMPHVAPQPSPRATPASDELCVSAAVNYRHNSVPDLACA